MKYSLLILLLTGAAFAQPVSFGVSGGVPFLDRGAGGDQSRPYIVGPSVEVRLPGSFALEVDALYQRVGSGYSGFLIGATNSLSYSYRTRGNSWEFPFLGKYYFRRRASWQPFAGTGWAFRKFSYDTEGTQIVPDGTGGFQPYPVRYHTHEPLGVGAAFAAGVRLRTGRIIWSPELRYTRWGGSNNLLRVNEAGVLLGLRF